MRWIQLKAMVLDVSKENDTNVKEPRLFVHPILKAGEP